MYQVKNYIRDVWYAYIHRIKFRVLRVRENDIVLRKFSGGTAQLRTEEGTLFVTDSVSLLAIDFVIILPVWLRP